MYENKLGRCWLFVAVVFIGIRLGIAAAVKSCDTCHPQRHSSGTQSAGDRAETSQEEKVQFGSGGHTLAGVLVLPTTPGPHPAVVFVHGSGSLSRNDWTLHPTLREHFARHGIASLCWDKPGVGASGGDWTQQCFRDRAQEALDAVKFLRGRREIDPNRVGLWGISQGGWICPLAASLSPDVAFIILVSAPTGTLAEQDLYRIEQGMHADGMPKEDIDSALNFARRRLDLVLASTFEALDTEQQKMAGQKWFTEYVHRLGPKDFAFAAKNRRRRHLRSSMLASLHPGSSLAAV
jgi:pimeloyl-ACP methyl ester carboxylesterase